MTDHIDIISDIDLLYGLYDIRSLDNCFLLFFAVFVHSVVFVCVASLCLRSQSIFRVVICSAEDAGKGECLLLDLIGS